ncbi:MAG: triose-phosphate isomerase [Pseudomonadota bacterium]
MRRKIAAGNWKMNGLQQDLAELAAMASTLPERPPQVIICPPTPLLVSAVHQAGPIAIGAQDCHIEQNGAFTGDVSAVMIADTGARFVILGHSERRAGHGETSAEVRAKVAAALGAGLDPIICIGETLETREAGETLSLIKDQLVQSLADTLDPTRAILAYEPVWAIGTGKVASPAEIGEVHDFIRATLSDIYTPEAAQTIPLLYGGSVKADNAKSIFATENVDGALVGGASLKASDFTPIIKALAHSTG